MRSTTQIWHRINVRVDWWTFFFHPEPPWARNRGSKIGLGCKRKSIFLGSEHTFWSTLSGNAGPSEHFLSIFSNDNQSVVLKTIELHLYGHFLFSDCEVGIFNFCRSAIFDPLWNLQMVSLSMETLIFLKIWSVVAHTVPGVSIKSQHLAPNRCQTTAKNHQKNMVFMQFLIHNVLL